MNVTHLHISIKYKTKKPCRKVILRQGLLFIRARSLEFGSLLEWREYKCELVVAIWHQIFRHRHTSPTVHTAQSGLNLVDAQISYISLLNFGRVTLTFRQSIVERLNGVVQCRSREGCSCMNFQAVTFGIGNAPPAYITLGAALLRTYIGIELLRHRLAV